MTTTQQITKGQTFTTDKGQTATVVKVGPKTVTYTNARGRVERLDRPQFESIFCPRKGA